MKTLLIFFLTIWLHQIVCQEKKVFVKTLPKKVKPYSKVQIINPSKAYRVKTVRSTKHGSKQYTAFPAMGTVQKAMNVPDSLDFTQELHVDQKPRVKKVLPDYVWTSLRSKRSADAVEKEKTDVKDEATNDKNVRKPKKLKGHHKNVHRGKKRKSKLNRHRHVKLGNRTRVLKNRQERDKKIKYTKKSNKHKVKRSGNKLRKGRNSTRKEKNVRKSKRVAKKLLPKDSARRLIAGLDAMIEDYPYVVSIQKSGEHWCAGALLNPRLVITTANCLWKASRISHMSIRAGSRHVHKGGQTAGIQEVMKHPGWGIRRNPDNDVGLILLDKNIRFSDSVHGVDLPNRVMMPAFDDVWVTSWGSERRDGVYVNRDNSLQVYHARLLDRAKCNNVTQRFGVSVTDNFICLTQTGRRAPCTRDTGAPAVSDGVLWGMASWGIRKLCGTERFPAIFSYLASQSNQDFIMNASLVLMADERFYPFPDRRPRVHVTTTTTELSTPSF